MAGKVALDSGLSTGGFTDCLLQYGASYVYGVDVGYGQVKFWQFGIDIMCRWSTFMSFFKWLNEKYVKTDQGIRELWSAKSTWS